MKLPAPIEKAVVKLALSKSGPLIQNAVTIVASIAVARLAAAVPGAEQYITPELLIPVLWLLINSAISQLPADVLKRYGTDIQKTLNKYGASLNEDGYVGPVTADVAKEILEEKGK